MTMNEKDYKKAPYALTDMELTTMPLSEVCALVKHIEESTAQIVNDLTIHTENIKMLRKFTENVANKETKPSNLMNPISNFKPY